jgi:hypothetical protein
MGLKRCPSLFIFGILNHDLQKADGQQVLQFRLSQKDVITDSFLLNQPVYDMTPPSPLPYPKLFYYSLDPARHYHHRFSPAYINSAKPLLIGSDLGLPVDELVLFTKEYNSSEVLLIET